jgi:hypothetical protein
MQNAGPAAALAGDGTPTADGVVATGAAAPARPAPRDTPAVPHSAVEARLLRHLDAATAQPSDESIAALRAALTDLVDEMKALGVPRASVVAAVEALSREHEARAQVLPLRPVAAGGWTATAIRARLPEWCARAYLDDAWW